MRDDPGAETRANKVLRVLHTPRAECPERDCDGIGHLVERLALEASGHMLSRLLHLLLKQVEVVAPWKLRLSRLKERPPRVP